MIRSHIFVLLSILIFSLQINARGRCLVPDSLVVMSGGDAYFVRLESSSLLSADDGTGGTGGMCLSGMMTYDQVMNLQDTGLRDAILRSLQNNSSWQQR